MDPNCTDAFNQLLISKVCRRYEAMGENRWAVIVLSYPSTISPRPRTTGRLPQPIELQPGHGQLLVEQHDPICEAAWLEATSAQISN